MCGLTIGTHVPTTSTTTVVAISPLEHVQFAVRCALPCDVSCKHVPGTLLGKQQEAAVERVTQDTRQQARHNTTAL